MKHIIVGLLLMLMSPVGWSDSFWTLYAVAEQRSPENKSQYIALISFSDRTACEESVKTTNHLIAETLETKILIRCLKTDGAAGGVKNQIEK
jgi:uncharacterized membrane protein